MDILSSHIVKSHKDFEQEIKTLKKQNKLLEWSILYLNGLLNSSNIDWLSSDEISLLNEQINYHKCLQKINSRYKNSLNKITSSWKTAFSELSLSLGKKELSGDNLASLEWILDSEQENLEDNFFDSSARDYIESTISIVWDFFRNYFIESQVISDFLDLFTIEYINFKEKQSGKKFSSDEYKKLIDDGINTLFINESDLLIIIMKVKKFLDLPEDLEIKFRINGNNEAKVEVVQVNISNTLISTFLWTQEPIEEWIQEWTEETREVINYASFLLPIKEKEKGKDFNYASFIEEEWLTERVKKTWEHLIEKILGIKLNEISLEERTSILINLRIFIAFITDMETDWRNISNNSWSTAEGYFQYLNKYSDRNDSNWKSNSFETALRRAYKYYTWKEYPPKEKFVDDRLPDWVKEAYNNYNNTDYDLKEMSAENQTLLFLIDIFYKKGTNKHLKWLLLKWSCSDMRRLYEDFHHTSKKKYTNLKTEKRTDEKIKKWQSSLVTG